VCAIAAILVSLGAATWQAPTGRVASAIFAVTSVVLIGFGIRAAARWVPTTRDRSFAVMSLALATVCICGLLVSGLVPLFNR